MFTPKFYLRNNKGGTAGHRLNDSRVVTVASVPKVVTEMIAVTVVLPSSLSEYKTQHISGNITL